MQLNSFILLDHCPDVVSYQINHQFSQFPLMNTCIWTQGAPICSGCVYIIQAAQCRAELLGAEENCLFLCAGDLDREIVHGAVSDVICCEATHTVPELFEIICGVFQTVAQWEDALVTALVQQQGLNRVCQLSTEFIKRGIMITGRDYSVLGKCAQEYLSPYSGQTEDDYMTEDIIRALELAPGFSKTFYERKPAFFFRDGAACIFSNVFIRNEYTARITVEYQDDIPTVGVQSLMIFLTKIVTRYLIVMDYSPNNVLLTFKSDLGRFIRGERMDSSSLSTALARQGWSEHDAYFCVVFRLDAFIELTHDMHYDMIMLEKNFPGSLLLSVDNSLLMICNTRISARDKEALRILIGEAVRDRLMKTGYSTLFHRFFDIPAYYRQAEAALELGQRLDPYCWQYDFNDYALRCLLEGGIHCLPPSALIPEELRTLLEHDQLYGTEYYNTLKVYLKQQRSATRCAQELFIHVSTFRYRLKNILDIVKADFSDPDISLYFLIIFRLIDEMRKDGAAT